MRTTFFRFVRHFQRKISSTFFATAVHLFSICVYDFCVSFRLFQAKCKRKKQQHKNWWKQQLDISKYVFTISSDWHTHATRNQMQCRWLLLLLLCALFWQYDLWHSTYNIFHLYIFLSFFRSPAHLHSVNYSGCFPVLFFSFVFVRIVGCIVVVVTISRYYSLLFASDIRIFVFDLTCALNVLYCAERTRVRWVRAGMRKSTVFVFSLAFGSALNSLFSLLIFFCSIFFPRSCHYCCYSTFHVYAFVFFASYLIFFCCSRLRINFFFCRSAFIYKQHRIEYVSNTILCSSFASSLPLSSKSLTSSSRGKFTQRTQKRMRFTYT